MSESTEKALRYLAQSPLFSGVSADLLRHMDPAPEMIFLRAGETLIRQDDQSTDYYVLVSGRLRVFRDTDGHHVPIGNILPGEGLGEMALLTNEPRFASVIARLDCEIVRFPQSTFLMLAATQPLLLLDIARTVIRRATGRAVSRQKNEYPAIAILPLTPAIDAKALACRLVSELKAYGSAHCVDSGFAGNLDELEERFDFVVYAGDSEGSDWSRSCLLRADLVLLAAKAADPPKPGQIEQELLGRTDRKILGRIDLILVHPADWQPECRTAQWLERVVPQEYHHIRFQNTVDLARLGRIVAGRANNIVLSGGGARAFAQIGVARAMKEAGIPIDRVGGCSMGAGVGAAMAFGDGFEEMVVKMKQLFLDRRPDKDLTLPLLSLLTGKKLADIGVDLCGRTRIEDLPIRYFCVSSDLGKGEVVAHFDGPLWIALRATAAMPGIAPPLFIDGRVLVDGGVLNNLPVDVMREHFSGRSFAVDVSRNEPLMVGARWDLSCPSGFTILLDRMNPYRVGGSPPSIVQMITRTATLASERQARDVRAKADLLFTPPVEGFSLMGFEAFDRIVEAGYRHAALVLEKWAGGGNETQPEI